MLRDPREKKKSEVTVVDGWVTQPSAHTLDHNAFDRDRASITFVRSMTENVAPSYLDESINRITSDDFKALIMEPPMSEQQSDDCFRRRTLTHKAHDPSLRRLWDKRYAEEDNGGVVNTYKCSSNGEEVSFNYNLKETVSAQFEKDRKAVGWPDNFTGANANANVD